MKVQKQRKKRRNRNKRKQQTKRIYGKGIFKVIRNFFSKNRDRRWG